MRSQENLPVDQNLHRDGLPQQNKTAGAIHIQGRDGYWWARFNRVHAIAKCRYLYVLVTVYHRNIFRDREGQ